MKRITTRFNDLEELDLELFKKQFHIDNDSEAIKLALYFGKNYIKNVTGLFFGVDYEIILQRKRKSKETDRKVW